MQNIGGLHIQYYSICTRKLWLYSKQIGFETEHDRVIEGTLLHETSYARKDKELVVGDAVIDVIDGEFIQETKLSSKMQHADEWQLLYYLYLLKQRGIEKRGKLAYAKEKKIVEVILTPEKEVELKRIIAKIYSILEADFAPRLKKLSYCKSCAYYDFCYVTEEDADAT